MDSFNTCLLAGALDGSQRVVEGGCERRDLHLTRQLYCATKPVIACGFLSVLEAEGIDYRDAALQPDGSLVPLGEGWSIADVLDHRVPFGRPGIWSLLVQPVERMERVLEEHAERAWAKGRDRTPTTHYGELLGWWLLDRCATRLLGTPFNRYLTERLRDALGTGRLVLAPDRALLDLPCSAIATVDAGHAGERFPLLHAVTTRMRCLTSSHFGGYGSAAALLDWYALLLRAARGLPVPAGLFPSSALRDLRVAATSDEEIVLGFQVAGPWQRNGSAALGHIAAGGSLAGWADFDRGVAYVGIADFFHEAVDARDAQLAQIVDSADGVRLEEVSA